MQGGMKPPGTRRSGARSRAGACNHALPAQHRGVSVFYSFRRVARGTVRSIWYATGDRHLSLIAAGVAFYAMLAVFPGVAALIAIWGFLSDPALIEAQMQPLARFVPREAFLLIDEQVRALIAANQSTLGWTTVLSLLAALWSARAGLAALIHGLDTIHGTTLRGGLGHTLAAIALTLALIGVAVVALAAVVIAPILLAFVPLGPFTIWAVTGLKWATAVIVVLMGITLLYRYGPNRQAQHAVWVSPGLLLAVAVWAGASVAFSYYLSNFGSYNRIYGSIGAVIALLMWFYISAYAVLLGAALNAEMERPVPEPRRAMDSAGQ